MVTFRVGVCGRTAAVGCRVSRSEDAVDHLPDKQYVSANNRGGTKPARGALLGGGGAGLGAAGLGPIPARSAQASDRPAAARAAIRGQGGGGAAGPGPAAPAYRF